MWLTSYWVEVDTKLKPYYCELHNCMFGGLRLKRTCLASNSKAIMALNILCTGDHDHAPEVCGIFGTAREAGIYTSASQGPCTYCFGVHCRSKRLKLSHFHSIAAGKQPSKMTSLLAVPECSYFGDERFAKWFCF